MTVRSMPGPVAPATAPEHPASEPLVRDWRLFAAVYAALWTAAVATYLLVPALHPYLWSVIGLIGAAALSHGVWLHRPQSVLPWALVTAALLTFVLGDSTYNLLTEGLGQSNPFPSLADVFYLLTYPLFAAAMVLFHRRMCPQRDRDGMLDALIITAGLGLLVWIYWIGPYVSADELGKLERVVSIAYPLGDVLLLLMLARLLMSAHFRPLALTLLTAGTISPFCRRRAVRKQPADGQLGERWRHRPLLVPVLRRVGSRCAAPVDAPADGRAADPPDRAEVVTAGHDRGLQPRRSGGAAAALHHRQGVRSRCDRGLQRRALRPGTDAARRGCASAAAFGRAGTRPAPGLG